MAREWMGLDEAHRKTSIILGLKFIVKERLWFHWEKFSDVSLNVATVVSRSKKKWTNEQMTTLEHCEHYDEPLWALKALVWAQPLGARRPGRGRGAHSREEIPERGRCEYQGDNSQPIKYQTIYMIQFHKYCFLMSLHGFMRL